MERKRINHLLDMVDELNSKLHVSASFEHRLNEEYVHITLLYTCNRTNGCSRSFSTYYCGYESYDFTYNDKDLIKAEAYMRMLLASAEHCEWMRKKP